jgi:coatomer subunit beta
LQAFLTKSIDRTLLIHAIHQIAIRFSEVAASVVGSLMDFISEINNSSAVDVIGFVKEVVEKFPKLRPNIVERLTALLGEQRASKVYRGALWIIGEYGKFDYRLSCSPLRGRMLILS